MTSKKTIIYSNLNFASHSAGKARMLYYAMSLAREIDAVYLISCCNSEIEKRDFEEVSPGVFLHRSKDSTTGFLSTFRFLKRLHGFAKSDGGSFSYLFYPSPLVNLELLSLIYLKGVKKNPVFYELNEVRKHSSAFHDPISLSSPKYSFKKVVFKTVFSLMEPLLLFYDGLICISTSIQKYGSRYNKNTLRVPILTDHPKPIPVLEKTYKSVGSFNIGFSGSIKPSKENLDSFMSVINELVLKGHSITFNLCGNVSDSDYKLVFDDLPKSFGWENVIKYHGRLAPNELSNFLVQQDLLVIPRGFTLQNKYGFSTKLSDYLNHERLILITDISDNKLYINDGLNGFMVPPDNNDAMFDKLDYIITNYETLKEKIIPNIAETSKTNFFYGNYAIPLKNFLFQSEG